MSDRFALIERKQAVQRQIEQARRRLERERLWLPTVNPRLIGQLETQLEQLMAEEHNLRLKIDQSK